MAEVVEDDAEFLSLVEAAEAAAVGGSAKRQKLSSSSSVASIPAVEEGSYMAALRGSHSSLWQQQQQLKLSQKKGNNSGGLRTGSNPPHSSSSTTGGACFKCGMAGHWARDCDTARGRERGEGSVSGGGFVGREDDGVPEKACPCGSGTCLVRTSNTAKNPGRKFYTCPLKLGTGSCGFFKWCNDKDTTTTEHAFGSKNPVTCENSSSKLFGDRSSSSCFKRGQGDQWSRECPKLSSDNYMETGVKHLGSTGSYTCFKCGKSGHGARECPSH
ncbi:GRF zinc finger [Musa troglodytarum]|uniref:GRF zinc finger n=1 Tax=Musa troglodytarum TaxID=320322 RepID=A0A9E7H055_9LILI|nr:GRF zinc finger [Musa troglodytarum]